jgi:hypothetical protein
MPHSFFFFLHTVARFYVFGTLDCFLPCTAVTSTFPPQVKRLSAANVAVVCSRGCRQRRPPRRVRRWGHHHVSCFTGAFRDPPPSTDHYLCMDILTFTGTLLASSKTSKKHADMIPDITKNTGFL